MSFGLLSYRGLLGGFDYAVVGWLTVVFSALEKERILSVALVHAVEPGPFVADSPEGNTFDSIFAWLLSVLNEHGKIIVVAGLELHCIVA